MLYKGIAFVFITIYIIIKVIIDIKQSFFKDPTISKIEIFKTYFFYHSFMIWFYLPKINLFFFVLHLIFIILAFLTGNLFCFFNNVALCQDSIFSANTIETVSVYSANGSDVSIGLSPTNSNISMSANSSISSEAGFSDSESSSSSLDSLEILDSDPNSDILFQLRVSPLYTFGSFQIAALFQFLEEHEQQSLDLFSILHPDIVGFKININQPNIFSMCIHDLDVLKNNYAFIFNSFHNYRINTFDALDLIRELLQQNEINAFLLENSNLKMSNFYMNRVNPYNLNALGLSSEISENIKDLINNPKLLEFNIKTAEMLKILSCYDVELKILLNNLQTSLENNNLNVDENNMIIPEVLAMNKPRVLPLLDSTNNIFNYGNNDLRHLYPEDLADNRIIYNIKLNQGFIINNNNSISNNRN